MRKSSLLSREQKQSRSLLCLPEALLPSAAGASPEGSRVAALDKELARLVHEAFLPKFERVEADVLQMKRFFIIEQRQTPVYIAFFEGLRDELRRDTATPGHAKSRSTVEDLTKSVKMPAQNRKRFMEPLERDAAAGICQTEVRNPLGKRDRTDKKGETLDGSETPGGAKTPNGISVGKSSNRGTVSRGEGTSKKGAVPPPALQLKVMKSPVSFSTKDLRIVHPEPKKPDFERTLKLDGSSASKKGGQGSLRTKENSSGNETGYQTLPPRFRKTPSDFDLSQMSKFLKNPAAGKVAKEGVKSVRTPKAAIGLANQLLNEVVDEIDELELANGSQTSEDPIRKLSKTNNLSKKNHKYTRSFAFPLQESPSQDTPVEPVREPEPLPNRFSLANKRPVPVYPVFLKKGEQHPERDMGSPKEPEDPLTLTHDISHASFETLEAMLLEREANLKREHFDQTKQQIIDSAVKFLPKNSRTLDLFSRSGSGEADVFIESMRHSLRTKITELDHQISAVKIDFPNLARESIRTAAAAPRFEPSNLCLLAFRTVSKKDVVRGMSPELFGTEVAKLFSLLGYFILEKRPLTELLGKPKLDLLNEVSDFYLAHLAAQTVEPIHRCNELTLPEKMSLEEFLDSNPGIFRLVSDVNLNAFYLSVAFLVFECLAFLGLRRFVGFMEKKRDGAGVLRNAAAELSFLTHKRDLYLAKIGDLGQMERDMHSFSGWAK